MRKVTNVNFDQEYEKLKTPQLDETDEQQKICKDILKTRKEPYKKKNRTIFDGPLRLGKSLELREDFYAVSFMHWLKRKAILADSIDSDAEPEPDSDPENNVDKDKDCDDKDTAEAEDKATVVNEQEGNEASNDG